MAKILFAFFLISICALSVYAQGGDPRPDDFIDIDQEPVALDNIQKLIEYPKAAVKSGLEGRVIVSVLLGTTGEVLKIKFDKVSDTIFMAPVAAALHRVRFSPAKLKGNPVKVWWTVPVVFKINPEEIKESESDEDPEMLDDIMKYLKLPDTFKKENQKGTIIISVLINETGEVEQVAVESTSNEVLIKALTDAVKKVKFEPAKKKHRPVRSWWSIPFSFETYHK